MLTVGIVLSSYNQVKYIKDCLESILNQQVNFSYIIFAADDCSTDGTRETILEYKNRFPGKIIMVDRQHNLGAGGNYMLGHNTAIGDIIFHIDGDDILMPGKLQSQYAVFEKYPDVNLVLHRSIYFSDDHSYFSETGALPDGSDLIFFSKKELSRWGTIAAHSTYAYRRSSRKVRQLDRGFMEWFFAMDSITPTGRGVFINQALLMYRSNTHGSYLSSSSGRRKAYGYYFLDIFSYFSKYPELRTNLYANLMITLLGMLRSERTLHKSAFLYLVRYCYYLRPRAIINTFKTRRSVAPQIKNR